MKPGRNLTLLIHFLLDELLPPLLRDSRWLMAPLMNLALGRESRWLREFKERAPAMGPGAIRDYYRRSAGAHLERETDLNSRCVEAIRREVAGDSVLDIACGSGYLTRLLAQDHRVTGADFVIDPGLAAQAHHIRWDQVDIVGLPYRDGEFDTVVCAHTLEHLADIHGALAELRRVAKRRLIVVLPRQRAYRYTFDLHLHFFPYRWQVELLMRSSGEGNPGRCENLGGDWFYVEDRPDPAAVSQSKPVD